MCNVLHNVLNGNGTWHIANELANCNKPFHTRCTPIARDNAVRIRSTILLIKLLRRGQARLHGDLLLDRLTKSKSGLPQSYFRNFSQAHVRRVVRSIVSGSAVTLHARVHYKSAVWDGKQRLVLSRHTVTL